MVDSSPETKSITPTRPHNAISILQLTTVPLSLGFLRGQPGYLRERGIDTTIISSPGPGLDEFCIAEDVTCIPIAMSREIQPLRDAISLLRLVRTFLTERPTIVHAQTPKAGLLGMLAGWITRRPVRVYSILGLRYMTTSGRRKTILQWSERLSCRLASSVICVSESMRQIAIADRLASPRKLKVLGHGSANGIDALGQFNPDQWTNIQREEMRNQRGVAGTGLAVGFIGRIVRDKGIEDLAAAWQSIRDAQPDAHIYLIGPEEPQDPVSPKVITELKADDRVHFVGQVANPADWYGLLDLVVLPSHREGLPNVPLEAAAMALPVVATNIPGCTDAVKDGVTGTLVPVRDPVALASSIERYLRNPALRDLHGQNGRARIVSEFQQEQVWEAIYQEYCHLLEARGIPVPPVNG